MDDQAVLLKILELQRRVDYLESSQEVLPLGADGWIRDYATWTYASATTFTVAGDQSARFTTGLKIKLTQTTVKYFYVLSSSFAAGSTTVTITAGSDYSLANAAITDNYYGRGSPLAGFPEWFNFTPAWTAAITQPVLGNGSLAARFNIRGKTLLFVMVLTWGSTTTGGSGIWSFSIPATSANPGGGFVFQWLGIVHARDAGVANYDSVAAIAQNLLVVSQFTDPDWGSNTNNFGATVPFTWGSADSMRVQIEYELP